MKYEITVRPDESISQMTAGIPDDGEKALVRLCEGVYREKVEVLRSNTVIEGCGAGKTVITWSDAATERMQDGRKRGTFRTASFRTDADDVTLRHLTIINNGGPREEAGQCIALYADGDHFVCEECELVSFQDTLFTAPLPPKEIIRDGFIGPKQHAPRKPQRHLYSRCRISGDIDFIFGGAAAWFEQCEIRAVDGRKRKDEPYVAFCSAASTPEGQKFGYVFHRCAFTGEHIPDHSVYLGRPWREYAKTLFLDCVFGPHIRPEAFHDWDKEEFHEKGFYGIYPSPEFADTMEHARILTEEEARCVTLEAFMDCL